MATVTAAVTTASAGAGGRTSRLRSPVFILVVALALTTGWLANTVWAASAEFKVVGEASGTVSVVNISGAKFCFMPSDGGAQRCGVAYQRRDAPALAVGDRVSVAVAELKVAPGTTREVFVIENSGTGQAP
jgi:hypothetical protein